MSQPQNPHPFHLASPQRAPARGHAEVLLEVVVGSHGVVTGGCSRASPPTSTPPHSRSMEGSSLGPAAGTQAPDGGSPECWLERHDSGLYHDAQAEAVPVLSRGRGLVAGDVVSVPLSVCRAGPLPWNNRLFTPSSTPEVTATADMFQQHHGLPTALCP